jgi:hypothetical protein
VCQTLRGTGATFCIDGSHAHCGTVRGRVENRVEWCLHVPPRYRIPNHNLHRTPAKVELRAMPRSVRTQVKVGGQSHVICCTPHLGLRSPMEEVDLYRTHPTVADIRGRRLCGFCLRSWKYSFNWLILQWRPTLSAKVAFDSFPISDRYIFGCQIHVGMTRWYYSPRAECMEIPRGNKALHAENRHIGQGR